MNILNKLDLTNYIEEFNSFFAREKKFVFEGDINVYYKYITYLEKYELKPLPKVKNLDDEITKLSKQAHLTIEQIFEFVKIISYFLYLKRIDFDEFLSSWVENIKIKDEIVLVCNNFDEKGNLKVNNFDDLENIEDQIYKMKQSIDEQLKKILFTKKLQPYLVDNQIHLVDGERCLLLRAGFNHFLKGKIISRSSAGFFYVIPDKISDTKKKLLDLYNVKSEIIYKIEKEFSLLLSNNLLFIKFINKEFDKLDHYIARINFARKNDFVFILPNNKSSVEKIVNFYHPAIKDCKPVTIDFSKDVLIFTGVNAGGKTMALKSILSAIFLSKYLLPYKANLDTKIKNYKNIFAIVDDPQNVKQDISTFAGRMVEFSKILKTSNSIIGADEIELGTDANEAAALFKAIILEAVKKNQKLIITTHHKRLASLLAKYDFVELYAAIYDEINQKPTYSFLQGTIGKSYAFETAIRYNIPRYIVDNAKKYYSDEKENLENLIDKSVNLEFIYQQRLKELKEKQQKQEELLKELQEKKEQFNIEIDKLKNDLEIKYKKAIDKAKEVIKQKDKKTMHKILNEANSYYKSIKKPQQISNYTFKVNDRVKFNNTIGIIKSISKDNAIFENEQGFKIKVKLYQLKPAIAPIKKKNVTIDISKPKQIDIKLDLHGLRVEEAIEKVDKFISDSLVAGLDEVLIYHGIGTGRLSKAVSDFLNKHKRVKSFEDAPPHMGGFGAKVVRL